MLISLACRNAQSTAFCRVASVLTAWPKCRTNRSSCHGSPSECSSAASSCQSPGSLDGAGSGEALFYHGAAGAQLMFRHRLFTTDTPYDCSPVRIVTGTCLSTSIAATLVWTRRVLHLVKRSDREGSQLSPTAVNLPANRASSQFQRGKSSGHYTKAGQAGGPWPGQGNGAV
jgi:hypothetical protein